MFDITKSKLYSQIMVGVASFFGLGADATETEVHAAIEGQKPLSEQLEAARAEAVQHLQSQLEEMKVTLQDQGQKISSLEDAVKLANEASEQKDQRISELQVEASGHTTALEALKTQHTVEIKSLAGQLAAAKAGRTLEVDENGDTHAGGKGQSTGGPVIVKAIPELEKLLKKRNA
ncbi:MAG: hypothetical protein ACRCVX_14225 [Shewanella sp.]